MRDHRFVASAVLAGGLSGVLFVYRGDSNPDTEQMAAGQSNDVFGLFRGTPSPEVWPPAEIYEGEPDWVTTPSLANFFAGASVVAEVLVEIGGGARFDTPSGGLPTEDPQGVDGGLRIYAPYILRVQQYYKGADAASGFVVPDWGGVRDGVTYAAWPGPVIETGVTGVVFLSDLYAAGPMDDYLKQRASELSSPSELYTAAIVDAFYGYDGNDVYSAVDNYEESHVVFGAQLAELLH